MVVDSGGKINGSDGIIDFVNSGIGIRGYWSDLGGVGGNIGGSVSGGIDGIIRIGSSGAGYQGKL